MPNGQNYFRPLALGQGGWLVGGMVLDDGTILARADTYNGWIRRPGVVQFAQMLQVGITVATNQLPLPRQNFYGAVDVAGCNTDSNYLAACLMGRIYMSTDNGANFLYKSAFGTLDFDPNGKGRAVHRKMAFDPVNGARMAVGFPGVGLKYTLNGGSSVTTHPDIPAPLGGSYTCVAVYFDRSSSTAGGYTNRVIVYSSGNGLYESTTGISGTFTHIASSPNYCTHVAIHPDNGAIFVGGEQTFPSSETGDSHEGEGQLRRYLSGSWTAPASCNSIKSIVCVPGTSGNRVYAFGSGGKVQCSYDAASSCTFTDRSGQTQSRRAPRTPWLAWTQEVYMSSGDTAWNPALNRVVFFEGIGVWEWQTPATSGTPSALIWDNIGDGIENMVAADALVAPDGRLLGSVQDRAFQNRERSQFRTYPSKHGPNNNDQLSHVLNQDYAMDNLDHSAGFCGSNSSTKKFGYSDNRGQSYVTPANIPKPFKLSADGGEDLWSGQIAISNRGIGLCLPIAGRPPYGCLDYTNPASPWAVPDFGATANAYLAEATEHKGLQGAYTLIRKSIICDKNTGRFYVYWVPDPVGSAYDLACRGIWESPPHNPLSFTRIKDTLIGSQIYDFWNSKYSQPFGQPGHMWWTAGTVGNNGDAHTPNPMYFSTDYQRNWAPLGGSAPTEVQAIGFAMNAPGALYPVIGAWSEDYGWYECLDFNPASPNSATWDFVSQYPNGHFDLVRGAGGDPGMYRRFYIANSGSSFLVKTFEARGVCN